MAGGRLPSSEARVEKLLDLVAGRERVLILVHDNPDPDAIAGALCLSHLIGTVPRVKSRIVYGGIVGRAENREMVRLLEAPLWSVANIKFRPDDGIVLVDTQPAFGNNSLGEGREVLAVIDHHPGEEISGVPLADVRPAYGAVTTIATEYLVAAGAPIPPLLATAICYGIGTETQDLGREAAPADIAAFLEAFPLCDQPLLGRLHHPRHPIAFFAELDAAIRSARVADGVLVSHLPAMSTPDRAAEMADMLASAEGIEWVLCTGAYEDRLVLSLRTSRRDARAGEMLRRVVGERTQAGGHGMMAGGYLALDKDDDPPALSAELTGRFLEALGRDPEPDWQPLMALPEVPKASQPPQDERAEA